MLANFLQCRKLVNLLAVFEHALQDQQRDQHHRGGIHKDDGLQISRQYYKSRNWAWLQRLRAPRNYPRRLAACAFYIILSLNAMLKSNELSIPRIYNLFRALHNGFYGKLRPF